MKNVNIISIFFVLYCCLSCLSEETIEKSNSNKIYGNGEPLNISNSPKIGAEFELAQIFFKKIGDKLEYFSVGEKVYEHKNKLISIDSDGISNFSDFEINTIPIDFTKAGLDQLKKACEETHVIFTEIFKHNYTTRGQKGINIYKTIHSGARSSEAEIFNLIKEEGLKEVTLEVGENLGFITADKNTKSYIVLCQADFEFVPQITFPLTNGAIYKLINQIDQELLDLYDRQNMKAFTTDFLTKINSPEAFEILGIMNENIELKGFIGLLYMNLYSFHHADKKLNLKNNTPIIKSRNDFGVLFRILPPYIKNYLQENNASKLLEIMSFLLRNNQSSVETNLLKIYGNKLLKTAYSFLGYTTTLDDKVFKSPVTLKKVQKQRLIAQELTIEKWLLGISQYNDLLVKKNYTEEFKNTPMEEIDELGYAGFGQFGNKTEIINGRECGVFEWRLHPWFLLNDKSGTDYVMKIARLAYDFNDMKE